MPPSAEPTSQERLVHIPSGPMTLEGTLSVPEGARGMVLFAHGSGSSRHSPRNRAVAAALQRGGLATLLLDLLTADEERAEARTRHLRFDIPLLAARLVGAADWLAQERETGDLAIGAFGASTGAAAALIAAAERPQAVRAVVSRGGRPDLAGEALPRVVAPTLLIVGGADGPVYWPEPRCAGAASRRPEAARTRPRRGPPVRGAGRAGKGAGAGARLVPPLPLTLRH